MYLGIDFLLDESGKLHISEVNTGLPGGAREYDLIHRIRFNRPSGIFDRIEEISEENFSKSFTRYIRELPYFDELKALKIWMDGKGPLPSSIPEMLRLEDKWVQYRLLGESFPMVASELFNEKKSAEYTAYIQKYGGIILKRRLGRGGAGFKKIKNFSRLKEVMNLNVAKDFYIVQPLIKSRLKIKDKYYMLSVRVMVFSGEFLCMFANISSRITSNHGIRFYVNPGNSFGVGDEDFRTIEITEKAWEADVFFKEEPPAYLYHNLYEEEISDSFVNIPRKMHSDIMNVAISISNFYSRLDVNKLPLCFIEEENFRKLQGFDLEE
jgi:glutathione synthase/RimK-type ligase-like ATP-grasp enzyme